MLISAHPIKITTVLFHFLEYFFEWTKLPVQELIKLVTAFDCEKNDENADSADWLLTGQIIEQLLNIVT